MIIVGKNNNAGGEEQLVVFTLANETYGVDISTVNEIIRMQEITEVPRTPDFVEGVINLRGRIVPVIDLRKRFNLETSEETQSSRIIVVELNDITVGMIVDSVSEVLRLPKENTEPTPPMVSGVDSAYLKGVGKWGEQLIILLDINKVLYKEEQEQIARTAEEMAAMAEDNGDE
ncbi:MAG: purine-binding chemotaxis protein CheW [Clostridia bacterium]|nr:purine-binding chemotaxis protein CheW [Clostridia bacterium]